MIVHGVEATVASVADLALPYKTPKCALYGFLNPPAWFCRENFFSSLMPMAKEWGYAASDCESLFLLVNFMFFYSTEELFGKEKQLYFILCLPSPELCPWKQSCSIPFLQPACEGQPSQ